MNYTDTLDKALSFLRELELDKALALFYRLLEEHPRDLSLINRIYNLEVKRPKSSAIPKICQHIFNLSSNLEEFHQLIVTAYDDFACDPAHLERFSREQLFNLLKHLSRSHFINDCQRLLERVKTQFSEDTDTPATILFYCESLILAKQLRKARQELSYLMLYYTEKPEAIVARKHLSWVNAHIIS